jgi:hypothetical protein
MSLAFDASRRSVDPTGTSKLRGKFRSDLQLRLRMLRAQLRVAVVEHDVLALGRGGIMSYHPPDVRLRAFSHWLEVAVASLVAGHWVRNYIMHASEAGVAAAVKELNLGTAAVRQASSNDLLEEQTVNEIVGIGDAMIQQVTRCAMVVIRRGMKAPKAYAMLASAFEKVALSRTKSLADTAVVAAYNGGKLDVYEAAGITHVGVDPELEGRPHERSPSRRPGQPRLDVLRQNLPRVGLQSRDVPHNGDSVSTTEVGIDPEIHPGTLRSDTSDAATGHNRPPVKRRRSRWKAEAVGVRTAGDEKVCLTCEAIAEDAPYTTAEARELIPAHPHCRCSVFPWFDKRFRRDSSLAGGLS